MSGRLSGSLLSRAKNCKYRNLILLVLLLTFLLSLALLILDAQRAAGEQTQIRRNGYGQGDRDVRLDVTVDGKRADGPLDVTVGERQYTEEELQQVFSRAGKELETRILGENRDLDHVTADLDLVTEIPDLPVTVEWELDRYDVMNVTGEIQAGALQEALAEEADGVLVGLRAFLTYTEDPKKQAVHAVSVRILEPERTAGEELLERIREEIRTYDGGNRTKESVRLPEEVGGKEIRYHLPMDPRGGVVLVMGILTAALLVCLEKQNEKKEGERRRQQMMLDYPQIVSQLNLLLGAGMSSKSAWKKIVDDYQQRRQTSGTRAAYEEMCAAWNEMCGGVPEKECYENFGSRCALQAYMKLGALLSQNLRKGTKGLADALRLEGIHAFEERKALAKRRGEEAGTKLLLPMFLMLAVVLVIVIVPAFLSIPL